MIHVSKEHNENPLNESILDLLFNENLEKNEIVELTEVVLSLKEESSAKSLSSSEMKEQDLEKCFEGLILKELPKHLKYVFLEEEKSKPVIIETSLNTKKGEKVKEILIRHKEAIAWSVDDLKGISPSICMHKILMEEIARTSIDH